MDEPVFNNAPCNCGSGKKYKDCCLDRKREETKTRRKTTVFLESFSRLHLTGLISVFVLLAVFACRQVSSPDVGFHIKGGVWILAANGWPDKDTLTYTVNDHDYVNTSWGYQAILALFYKIGGAPGMVLLHILILIGTFAIVVRTARIDRGSSAMLVVLLLMGIVACETRFQTRPEVLSMLLLASVLHILQRHAEGRPTAVWALPVLMVIWANCHSLFVVGWGAILCCFFGAWIRNRAPDRELMIYGGAAFPAALLTPYHVHGVIFPFTLLSRFGEDNPFGGTIREFMSPFEVVFGGTHAFYPAVPLITFVVFAFLSVPALWFLFRQNRYACLALWLAFAPVAFLMTRNIPLFVVAFLPPMVFAYGSRTLIKRLSPPLWLRKGFTVTALSAVMGVVLVTGLRVFNDGYYINARRPDRFGMSWNRTALPVDAAEFIRTTNLKGPMLNHLNFGGYLMHALAQRVYIDGRLEVMGEEFFRSYLAVLEDEKKFDAEVEKRDIRYLIFPYATEPGLLQRMSKKKGWNLAYADAVAAVFVRDSGNPDFAMRTAHSEDLSRVPGVRGNDRESGAGWWLKGLIRRENLPAEDYYLGLFHLYRGEAEQAEQRFNAAIVNSGGAYFEMYHNLGLLLFRREQYLEARDCFLIVTRADPSNRLASERLEECLRRLRR